MRNEQSQEILNEYDIREAEIAFIRHNENRTYKVKGHDGSTYLAHSSTGQRRHGRSDTYEGLMGESQMLEHLSTRNHLLVQRPVRNREGELITIIEHEGSVGTAPCLPGWKEETCIRMT